MRRDDVTFVSGGVNCAAWLYMPDGDGPFPAVVMGHGLTGTREIRMDTYAERFAAAGCAVVVFDYRHFGASEGQPRQLLDISKQLDDWRAAVAYARSRSEIDADRVALWGSSFSGGHVTVLAAEDQRIAACIAQVPFMDGLTAVMAIDAALLLRLVIAALRDQWRAWSGGDPYTVPAVALPGEVAAITTAGAAEGFLALIPPKSNWRNEVAARVFLRLLFYRPVKSAARVRCPLLVCVAEDDAITPPPPAEKAARVAPRGELRTYGGGHFDIYLGELFEQAVRDQVDFLRRHVIADR